jgi:predicted MFS family arabinose efflux permease
MSTTAQLIIVSVLRIILNTFRRMVYPFLSVFARGLGVEVTAFSLALTGRNVVGIFGPLLAPISDVRGRKLGMLSGVALFTLGMALVALWPGVPTFAAALILGMLGQSLFDPAVHAYFGDRVAYERRGTAVAIAESAWSLAFIAGVPAMGLLIVKFGWQAPFPVLAALGLAMLLVLWQVIPHDGRNRQSAPALANIQSVLRSIPALAGISIALWSSAANEMVTLVFGLWLTDSFGMKIAALAGASAVIGLAELGGEGLVATVTDRIGKPRAVALGLAANIGASALLPWIGRTEAGALAGLFLFYLSFEYLVVSQIPMMTEVVPAARATTIALNSIGFSIGRSGGALLSTLIYTRLGFLPVTAVAVVFNILALLALAEMQQRLHIVGRLLAWLARPRKGG